MFLIILLIFNQLTYLDYISLPIASQTKLIFDKKKFSLIFTNKILEKYISE